MQSPLIYGRCLWLYNKFWFFTKESALLLSHHILVYPCLTLAYNSWYATMGRKQIKYSSRMMSKYAYKVNPWRLNGPYNIMHSYVMYFMVCTNKNSQRYIMFTMISLTDLYQSAMQTLMKSFYRKISNISRTKSQDLNVSRLVSQFYLPNSLKTGVKLRMKM